MWAAKSFKDVLLSRDTACTKPVVTPQPTETKREVVAPTDFPVLVPPTPAFVVDQAYIEKCFTKGKPQQAYYSAYDEIDVISEAGMKEPTERLGALWDYLQMNRPSRRNRRAKEKKVTDPENYWILVRVLRDYLITRHYRPALAVSEDIEDVQRAYDMGEREETPVQLANHRLAKFDEKIHKLKQDREEKAAQGFSFPYPTGKRPADPSKEEDKNLPPGTMVDETYDQWQSRKWQAEYQYKQDRMDPDAEKKDEKELAYLVKEAVAFYHERIKVEKTRLARCGGICLGPWKEPEESDTKKPAKTFAHFALSEAAQQLYTVYIAYEQVASDTWEKDALEVMRFIIETGNSLHANDWRSYHGRNYWRRGELDEEFFRTTVKTVADWKKELHWIMGVYLRFKNVRPPFRPTPETDGDITYPSCSCCGEQEENREVYPSYASYLGALLKYGFKILAGEDLVKYVLGLETNTSAFEADKLAMYRREAPEIYSEIATCYAGYWVRDEDKKSNKFPLMPKAEKRKYLAFKLAIITECTVPSDKDKELQDAWITHYYPDLAKLCIDPEHRAVIVSKLSG